MLNSGDITEINQGTHVGSEAGLRRPTVVVTAVGALRGEPAVAQG
ncbi:mRNA-degrading endonuclease toxin of MazEF toxin-antitoxin module [Dermacoccus sp. GAS27A]